jgi:hypothetical protein
LKFAEKTRLGTFEIMGSEDRHTHSLDDSDIRKAPMAAHELIDSQTRLGYCPAAVKRAVLETLEEKDQFLAKHMTTTLINNSRKKMFLSCRKTSGGPASEIRAIRSISGVTSTKNLNQ